MPPRGRRPVQEPFLAGNPLHFRATKLNKEILKTVRKANAAKQSKDTTMEAIYQGKVRALQRNMGQLLVDAGTFAQRLKAYEAKKKQNHKLPLTGVPEHVIRKMPVGARTEIAALSELLVKKIADAAVIEKKWNEQTDVAIRRIHEGSHLHLAATAGTLLTEINMIRTRYGFEPLKMDHFGVVSQSVRKPQEGKNPKMKKREGASPPKRKRNRTTQA